MSKSTGPSRGRRRRKYWFGVELSGLERPRQWLGAVLAAFATVLAMALIAFLAFG
jgi:hypothetical protein